MHELHAQAVIHEIRLHEQQVIENTQRQLTMAFTRLAVNSMHLARCPARSCLLAHARSSDKETNSNLCYIDNVAPRNLLTKR